MHLKREQTFMNLLTCHICRINKVDHKGSYCRDCHKIYRKKNSTAFKMLKTQVIEGKIEDISFLCRKCSTDKSITEMASKNNCIKCLRISQIQFNKNYLKKRRESYNIKYREKKALGIDLTPVYKNCYICRTPFSTPNKFRFCTNCREKHYELIRNNGVMEYRRAIKNGIAGNWDLIKKRKCRKCNEKKHLVYFHPKSYMCNTCHKYRKTDPNNPFHKKGPDEQGQNTQ